MSGLGLTFLRRGGQAHPTQKSAYLLSPEKGDAEVLRILIAKGVSSDGIGITKEDAARVTDIGKWFSGTSIKSFPELKEFGITSLTPGTFQTCRSLTTLVLGYNVNFLGGSNFADCSALTTLVVCATTPPTIGGGNVFAYATRVTIYVPDASVELYASSSIWSSRTIKGISTLATTNPTLYEDIMNYLSK